MKSIIEFKAVAYITLMLALPAAAPGAETPPGKGKPEPEKSEIRLPENSQLFGSWHGTLGNQDVMVCISDQHATYYTVGHYSRVVMELRDSGALRWQESSPAGRQGIWKIDAENKETITGEWTNHQETLPIRLERMHAKQNMRFCEEIYQELALAAPVNRGQEQTLDGLRFRKISAIKDYLSSVEILDESGKYAALNKRLRDEFIQHITSAYACQDQHLFEMGKDEEFPYARDTSLFAVMGPWVTLLNNGGGHCGVLPADNLPRLSTLEIDTAQPLKLNAWLTKDSERDWVDGEGPLYAPPERLTRIIYAHAMELEKKIRTKDDPECEAIYDSDPLEPMFAISLSTKGIIFSTSYAPAIANLCNVYGVEVPFSKLTRFLTPTGKQGVKLLKQSKGKTG